jgi:integrase
MSLERWLDDYASTKTPATYVGFRALVRNWITPNLGKVQVGKITPSHVVRLLRTVREAKRLDGEDGGLSPQTIRHVYNCLHLALACAVRWQIIPHNPADAVDAPSVPKTEMRTFTVEEAQRFLAASAAEGIKWETFFRVAITSGLRSGELKGLRWIDVDLGKGTIAVQQNIQRVTSVGWVTKPPKTATGRRPIAIDADVVALLRRHQEAQSAERSAIGPLWKGATGQERLIFASAAGTPLEDKRVHAVFTRICERAGVPRIRPYDLRHSCASLLLAAGVSPKVVSERLGHSSAAFTLQTYSHVLPTLQRDAADTLGAMLRPSR